MKKISQLFLFALLSASAVKGQLSADSLEYFIKREVSGRRSIGMAAGLLEHGKKQFMSAGIIGEEDKGLPNGKTTYEIGSITKVFTALLLADLVVKKEVGLYDPISKYLPAGINAPKRNGKEITLYHLVTHTSGLPNLPLNLIQSDVSNPFATYTVREMYEFLSDYSLPRDVGSKYEYSNYGAAPLGNILSRITGSEYETMIQKRISAPLKMKNTTIHLTRKQKSNLASGFDRFGKPVASYRDFDAFVSAAAIRSTVDDLLLFADANLGLKQTKLDAAIRLSHTILDTTGMADLDIAMGWHSFRRHGKQILWHNGATGGFKSFIGLDKESKRAVVILTNGGNPVDDLSLHALSKNYKLQTFKYPWRLKDEISNSVESKGLDSAIQLYWNLKKEQSSNYVFNEQQLHTVGTDLLLAKKYQEAIAIFELNAQEYPKSWRTFNNLGEAHKAAGNNRLAKEAYEKSLELNPQNTNATEALKKLP